MQMNTKNEKTPKKLGRPFSDAPLSGNLPRVRVKLEQLETYKMAAKSAGKPLAVWVRKLLDEASGYSDSAE